MFLALPLPDMQEMAKTLYQLPYFSRATLEDYTGLAREDLKTLLKFMTTRHLVDKFHGDYRRLPLGTELFENMDIYPPDNEEVKRARQVFYGGVEL